MSREAVQERAFTAWINATLQKHEDGGEITDLLTAFSDGVQLIRLVESLAGKSIGVRYTAQATMRVHRIENLNLALQFAQDVGLRVDSSTVVAEDFLDGIYPQIAGFVWMLFKQSQSRDTEGGPSLDTDLLEWCAATAAQVVSGGIVVEDFSTSFQDGRVLAAVVAASDPSANTELVRQLSQQDGSDLELVGMATAAAAAGPLNVPEVVEPAAIAAGKADAKSMQIYVTMLRRAWLQITEQRARDAPAQSARVAELEAALSAVRRELCAEQERSAAAEQSLAGALGQVTAEKTGRIAAENAVCEECAALRAELAALRAELEAHAAEKERLIQSHAASNALMESRVTEQFEAATKGASQRNLLQAEVERLTAELATATAVNVQQTSRIEEDRRLHEAAKDSLTAEVGVLRESQQQAVGSARQHEQAAISNAAEATKLRNTVREVTRQAKAAVEDGRIKAESALLGRVALVEEQQIARQQLLSVRNARDELKAAAGDMAHYAMTAFWGGDATLPYGVQMSGWLDKMSVEKSKDYREDTAGQVAKKHSKQAKNWGRDMLDRTWKKRWFVLSGACLYYYKSPDDASANPKGVLFLHNARIRAAAFPASQGQWWQGSSGHGAKYVESLGQGDDAMSIRVEGHSIALNLKAKDEAERIAWGTALQKHIAFCDYLGQCWSEGGHPSPSPHLAQLLLDVAPGDGIGAKAAAEGKLTVGHDRSVTRIAVPPGSKLMAAASAALLGSVLGRAAPQLQILTLRRAEMSAAGLSHLASAALPKLTNLTELDVARLVLSGDAVESAAIGLLDALPAFRGTLSKLQLDGLPLQSGGPALARGLSALAQLQNLSLADCMLGDAGIFSVFSPVCPQRHHLTSAMDSECFCDGCSARGLEVIGTAFRCSAGCDFDLCSQCFATGCQSRRVLSQHLATLDLRGNNLTSAVCGQANSDTIRAAFGANKAKPSTGGSSRTVTVSIPKGPRGFGMMISKNCKVESFSAQGGSAAEHAGVALGSRILSVNGTPVADKASIAAVLSAMSQGCTVDFEMEVTLPEPPSRPGSKAKPRPPPGSRPAPTHEGIPPSGPAGLPPTCWIGPLSCALATVPGLVRLELGENSLCCNGVQALVGFALAPGTCPAGLRHVGLSRAGVGEIGLRAIAALLSDSASSICTVDLGGNTMMGSLSAGIGFGREGRGPLFQFEQLLLRR